MAEGSSRRRRSSHQPGWAGFRADLASARARFLLRSSPDHKRFVWAVIALGTLLRLLRMDAPVSYDEAFTYVHYASRSFGFLFSDYVFTGNHILYSALARLSTLALGIHPWSLRLPALVAGVLLMPLFYAFARLVFNRHIGAICLCLLAVSGPLVEYSAMARGYALVWLCTAAALLAARHFVRSDNGASAALLALFCALGVWATPVMAYPALMVYCWAAGMLVLGYQRTVKRRMLRLTGSLVLAMVLCLACYAPVVVAHSMDQLLHHPSMVDNTWAHFVNTQQDRTFDLWAYFTGTATTLLAVAGLVAVTYAAYISAKYRLLLFGMAAGAIPLVVLQRYVAPPAAWTYTLPILHLGSAIGLFYLLKFVRDKFAPGFSKQQRTLVAGAAVLLVFGWFGLRGNRDAVDRFPEAKLAAAWIAAHTQPGDRVCVEMPWDAPVGFYLACSKADPHVLDATGQPPGNTYVIVAPSHGQAPSTVLRNTGVMLQAAPDAIAGWNRLEVYPAR